MDISMLMKEINVTEIPDNLKSDYEWNNKWSFILLRYISTLY